jgi:PST family polysaccharide transporter
MLDPADFGLFALGFVMIEGLNIMKSLGIDSALVRRQDDVKKAADTAFFLIPASGLLFFVILFIVAPVGASFLNEPSLTDIVRALGLVFLISCLGKVPQTMLYKDMKFNYRSIAELISKLIYISVVIFLALNGFGVWSLIVAYIIQNIVQVSMEWYYSGWKPTFHFDGKIAWEMFRFGKYMLASGIVGYVYSNSDNLLVGKILGVTALGYYSFARNFSNYLNENIFSRLGVILYPAYSKIQNENEELRNIVLKMIKYVSFFSFPFCCLILIYSQELLFVFFGAKWLPASNILRIITFVGVFNSISAMMWPVFLAKGQSKIEFYITLLQTSVFLILVVPLTIKYHLIGAGVALLLSSILSFLVGIIRLKQSIKLQLMPIIKSFKVSIIASLIMLFIGMTVNTVIINNIYYNILIKGLLSAFSYCISGYLLEKDLFINLKNLYSLKKVS